jgi:hypothetical protein
MGGLMRIMTDWEIEQENLTGEELEAAGEMFDGLEKGDFYKRQEESGFTVNYLEKGEA